MAADGGPEVARIHVRVVPNLRGFRKKVKDGAEHAAREASGEDIRFDSDVDEGQTRRKARKAAKTASGQDVDFDPELSASELAAKSKLAAIAASGRKVNFGVDIDRTGLRGLMRSITKGFSTVDSRRSSGRLFDNRFVQESVDNILSGLRAVDRAGRRIPRTLTRGMKTFGRTARQAVQPVRTLGKGLTGLAGRSELLRAYGDDLGDAFDRLGTRWSTFRKRFEKAPAPSAFEAMKEIIDREVDRVHAVQRQRGEPRKVLRQMLKDVAKASAGVDGADGWADRARQVQRDLGAIRRKIQDNSDAAQAFDKNIGQAFQRMREGDRSRFGRAMDTARFHLGDQRDRVRQSQFVEKLGRDFQKAQVRAMKLRDTTQKMGRDFRRSPFGQQMEQSLLRSRGAATALRNRVREVGDSNGFQRISRQAERTARAIRNIDVKSAFSTGGRGRQGAWTPEGMSRMTRQTGAFRKQTDGLGGALGKVTKGFKKAGKSGDGFFKSFRQKYFQPDSQVGFLILAITALLAPAITMLGSLMAGLPTLLAGVGAAAAVVALGFDGIRDSVQPLQDALAPLQESLSNVFRQELTPQFEKLAAIMPALAPGMEAVARGVTTMMGAFTDTFTAPQSVELLNGLLDKTAGLFEGMAPGIASFTEGFLTMFDGAAAGFPYMSREFNKFADLFQRDMSRLVDTGQMDAAMDGLAKVTGSLFTELHNILVSGVEHMPEMSEGLINLFEGLGDMLVRSMPLLTDFSNFLGNTLGSLGTHIGNVFEEIQPNMSRIFDSLSDTFGAVIKEVGPGLTDMAGGLSRAFANVAEKVGGAIQRLAPDIGNLVETLGEGLVSVLDELTQGDNIDRLVNSLFNLAEAAVQFATSGLESIIPQLPDLVNSLADLATTLADGLIEDLIRLANDALPGAIAALELLVEVLDKVSGAMSSVAGFMDGPVGSGLMNIGGNIMDTILPGNPTGMMKGLSSMFSGASADADKTAESFRDIGEAAVESGRASAAVDYTPPLTRATEGAERMADNMNGVGGSFSRAADNPPDFVTPLNEQVAGLSGPLSRIPAATREQTAAAAEGANVNLQQIPQHAGNAGRNATAAVSQGLGGMAGAVTGATLGVTAGMRNGLSGMESEASGAASGAVSGVQTGLAPLPTAVVDATSAAEGAAAVGMAGVVAAIQDGITVAGATAATLVPTVRAGIGPTAGALTGSGSALVAGFVSGMRSQIPAVRAAASEIAQAAKDSFPNSPAKEGPLSGRGYTTYSGEALVKDFAGGMVGARGYAATAASDIAGTVRKGLEQANARFTEFNQDKILDPVLEANAKKLARHRERVEEGNFRSAEAQAEAYQDMLDDLEVPDYREIDRSFRGYYMDGATGMIQQSLDNMNIADQLRSVTDDAFSAIRKEWGEHPLMAQIETNMEADHFEWAVQKAVEESNLAAVPIEFAVSNLDQLKSDLGFGDGAVSRAMDAAMDFNPNNTDAFRHEKADTEVHYHVADMQEAIRLHEENKRKQSLRFK